MNLDVSADDVRTSVDFNGRLTDKNAARIIVIVEIRAVRISRKCDIVPVVTKVGPNFLGFGHLSTLGQSLPL